MIFVKIDFFFYIFLIVKIYHNVRPRKSNFLEKRLKGMIMRRYFTRTDNVSYYIAFFNIIWFCTFLCAKSYRFRITHAWRQKKKNNTTIRITVLHYVWPRKSCVKNIIRIFFPSLKDFILSVIFFFFPRTMRRICYWISFYRFSRFVFSTYNEKISQ